MVLESRGELVRYASVCDGIGAVHCAWHPLGWECAWTSEIARFPSAVVDHHWSLPNLGDMTEIADDDLGECGPVELLVGGTPCQSFSVAGLREGMDDPRGNLALVYLGLVSRIRPRWVVWENVPSVLSSSEGRDFGSFVGGLAKLGYGWAYRIMDAQYVRVESHPYAVPQRRRRVFVVGYLGDWRRAAAVLLERQGMFGHPPPRREAGKGAARTLTSSTGGVSAKEQQATFIGADGRPLNALDAGEPVAFNHQAAGDQTTLGYDPGSGVSSPLVRNQTPAVVFQPRIGRNGRGDSVEVCSALNGAGATSDMRHATCVVLPTGQQGVGFAQNTRDEGSVDRG